jgi:hypothetical protein
MFELRPSGPLLLVPMRDHGRTKRGLWVLCVLLLWLGQLSLPRVIADAALDPSWSHAIGRLLAQRWQVGEDWSFTYGPLGWFATVVDEPLLWWPRYWLFELGWRLAASCVLASAFWRLEQLWQRALAVLLATVLPLEFDAYAIALLAAACVLLGEPQRAWVRWGLAGLLASLALIKFTLLVASAGALAALCFSRQWKRGFADLGRMLTCVLLLWILLGQSPSNLLPWFQNSLQIAAAYGSGQSKTPPTDQLVLALAVMACQVVLLLRGSSGPGLKLALAGAYFVSWKAGITRGDDHTPYFLGFAALAPWLCGSGSQAAVRVAASALAVTALILAPDVSRPKPSQWPLLAIERAWAGFTPAQTREQLDSERLKRAARFDRPQIRARVGDAPIDVYNHHQGVALLNGLNYQPRPIPHSYVAFTPRLQSLDVAGYRTRPPQFVLFRLATIDDRFPMHEHSQLLDHYLRAYEPVLNERGDLLLERSAAEADLKITPMRRREGSWGEWIDVPQVADGQIRLALDLKPNPAGKLVNLLYRSAELMMDIEDDQQRVRSFRVVPELARDPFVLGPLVLGNEGFVALYERTPLPRPRRIRLQCPPNFRFGWPDRFGVEFHRGELQREPMTGLAARIGASLFERTPVGVDAPRDLLRLDHAGLEKVFCFAPSSLTFALTPADRRVEARFGLESDPQGGTSSGRICMRVAVVERGQLRLLAERWLEPGRNPADRGPQTLQVELPAGQPEYLILAATLPEGDALRNAWFWWSGIRILPAR